MPDDNKTTDTNPTPPIPPMEPSISLSSPPPAPPSDQGQPTDAPPPATDSTIPPPPPIVEEQPAGTAAPPVQGADIPPVVTTAGAPKRRFGGKKVIATILGILFLVGGVSAGVILVQRQQEIREKASIAEPCNICQNGICTSQGVSPPDCTPSLNECSTPGSRSGCPQPTTPTPTLIPTRTPAATPTPQPPNACDRSAPDVAPGPNPNDYTQPYSDGGFYCDDRPIGSYCETRSTGQSGTCQEIGDSSLGGTQVECKCEIGGIISVPTATPTPPPNGRISAQCLNIQAFDTDWNSLTNEQLAALKPGDKVRFTVGGTTTQGAIDKARFTINGTQRSEVTQKRPTTNEFYDEYTIPEGVTSFSINAQLHHTSPDIGWF